ncbi:ESCRT-I complex subunit tsg101-like, partial [Cydia splendana]|uniref:ESCRT-I complex subunit tsg101-like n=1 Tax=Cydia splendana TaxID=1100963 RepID=UPI00300D9423
IIILGDAVKKKWKTIRDGYFKNKRILKGKTGSGRIVSNYIWAEQLRFLDDFNVVRPRSSNITQSNETNSTDSDNTNSPQPPPSPQPSPPQSSPVAQVPSSSQHSLSPNPVEPEYSQRETPPSSQRRTSGSRQSEDPLNKIINYLNNKPKTNKAKDSIDYLFQSYAETFKKFSPELQTKIKLELAKLFSEAELRSLREESSRTNQVSFVLSPSYSMISSVDSHEETTREVDSDFNIVEIAVERERFNNPEPESD